MIVSLAGHVDHGKTSLVKALTGVVTDRLKEEAQRGLTIDLGFAYLKQDSTTLGFVDVPGHQRFIHNMVAGVSAHQCALLVVAADDGPMPQTQEHLNIMQVLGLQRGIVAISKTDRVEPGRVAAVKAELQDLLKGSFLADAPIVPVCAHTGDGIPELLSAINTTGAAPATVIEANARLAIDRAFTIKGQGVVVTGTLYCGNISLDDELHLFPSGQKVRVRSLHVQDANAQQAQAGDRCAVNISGSNVTLKDVGRGQWLMTNRPTPHRQLVARLELLANYPRALKHWTAVHLYHGTSHSVAQLALLDAAQLQPGGSALVELNCNEPLNAKRGDRLVLRDYGQDQTIGGAWLLHNGTWQGRRRASTRIDTLFPTPGAQAQDHLSWALGQGVVDVGAWQLLWDLTDTQAQDLIDLQDCVLQRPFAFASATVQALETSILHQLQQSTNGLTAGELVFADAQPHPAMARLALQQLVQGKRITSQSGRYVLPGNSSRLTAAEDKMLALLTKHLDTDQPPSLGDIAKLASSPLDSLKRGAKALAAKGELVLVGDSRAFLPHRFMALVELAQKLQRFSVKDFRDASGLGRNLVIEVLERLDARGFTRRNGNERSVVGDINKLKL